MTKAKYFRYCLLNFLFCMRNLFFLAWCFSALFAKAQVADSTMRKLYVTGAVNFRDLGGYKTADGRQVKWHLLYRSAELSKLTPGDLALMKSRNITYDVDFRGVEESQAAPDKMNPNTDYTLCSAGGLNSLSDFVKSAATLTSGGDSMMINYYSKTELLAPRYKPFFEKLLAVPDDQALVFHCTAGKDRTGIGAALLLYALGVPYEIIMQDYLATNYYRQEATVKLINQMVQMHVNQSVASDLAAAKQQYLDATFDAIKKQYGSIDNFLKGPLELDDQKIEILKRKFLE
jgi:protein-tyrosine phosphatase